MSPLNPMDWINQVKQTWGLKCAFFRLSMYFDGNIGAVFHNTRIVRIGQWYSIIHSPGGPRPRPALVRSHWEDGTVMLAQAYPEPATINISTLYVGAESSNPSLSLSVAPGLFHHKKGLSPLQCRLESWQDLMSVIVCQSLLRRRGVKRWHLNEKEIGLNIRMNFTGDIRTKRLLLFVMSSCCMIFGSFTLIFKEKIFATILHSVSFVLI